MTKWWQRVSTKRPLTVVLVSLIVMIGVGWYAVGLFGQLANGNDSFFAGNTESAQVADGIEEHFGETEAANIVLFERQDDNLGDATSQQYQDEVERLLQPLQADASEIVTYREQPTDALLSRDKSSTYALVTMKSTSDDEIYEQLSAYADEVDQSKLAVSVGGNVMGQYQTTEQVTQDLIQAELITIPILLVLLLFFFRGVVAAAIPLVMSLLTIVGAFAISRFGASYVTVDHYVVNVVTILGLGLAVDYSLLMINRFREELGRGKSVDAAVRKVIVTSGKTIFFSGITVIACLLSLLLIPVDFLASIAVGGSSAVAMAIAVTIIVLPSVLSLLGTHINRWKVGLPQRKTSAGKHTVWWRAAHLSARRPFVALTLALLAVVVVVSPLTQIREVPVDHKWLAQGSSSQYVGTQIENEYDTQSPSITVLSVFNSDMSQTEKIDLSCDLTRKIQKVDGVQSVASATPISETLSCDQIKLLAASGQLPVQLQEVVDQNVSDTALRFSVTLADGAGSTSANDAVVALRDISSDRSTITVGGLAAMSYDTTSAYINAGPFAFAVVAFSMVVLLSLLLRSVVLPLQAVIINTIALGISLGVLVVIFQFGWLADIFGWAHTEGLNMTAPVLVIAIAFGLAMDYSVFLYARMREAYDETKNPTKAVEQGVIRTGPIITAAAMVFFVVVIAFAFSSVAFLQIIGVGLAIAVLVDAFFVRLVIVPAVMRLMGHASWYAPKWVKRWQIRHD